MRSRDRRLRACLSGRWTSSATWRLGCRNRLLSIWAAWCRSDRGYRLHSGIWNPGRCSRGTLDWHGGQGRWRPMRVLRTGFRVGRASEGLVIWYFGTNRYRRGVWQPTYKTCNGEPIIYVKFEFSTVFSRQMMEMRSIYWNTGARILPNDALWSNLSTQIGKGTARKCTHPTRIFGF